MSAKGVSEVASIGGFVKEYQVDIDPNAMKAYGVNVAQVMKAVKKSNLDIGARTIEYNKAEYLIRALGYVKSLNDIEESVVAVHDNVPVRIKDVAKVNFGPATRRGGLDKGGAEAVGGVVVARYGANPMEVINNVKEKIREISPGLPSKTLNDGTVSKVTIVPFYDRTGLIKETLGTLESALTDEILISIIVVIILVLNLRASFLISSLLPIGVLITFIVMRKFGVDANIVALSGIAIAIGVMVDVGIVFTENIIRHLEMPENKGAQGQEAAQCHLQCNNRSSFGHHNGPGHNHYQLPSGICHAGCRRKTFQTAGLHQNICLAGIAGNRDHDHSGHGHNLFLHPVRQKTCARDMEWYSHRSGPCLSDLCSIPGWRCHWLPLGSTTCWLTAGRRRESKFAKL